MKYKYNKIFFVSTSLKSKINQKKGLPILWHCATFELLANLNQFYVLRNINSMQIPEY